MDMDRVSSYAQELQHAKEQKEMWDAVAAQVYDLLKENSVSIADSIQILKIAKRLVNGATWEAMLP